METKIFHNKKKFQPRQFQSNFQFTYLDRQDNDLHEIENAKDEATYFPKKELCTKFQTEFEEIE